MGNFLKTCWTTVFSLVIFSIQAAAVPKVGAKAPLLQATDLLQAPAGAKMDAEALRGKVVVLEFWATWCGPCVAAIPHMNELADEFKGKPVQFIAITAEDKPTVEQFLSKRPIHSWVALDTNSAMNKAYGIVAIPATVVLDQEGKIAAVTYPTFLTETNINDLLAGKKIEPRSGGGATVSAQREKLQKEKEAPPLFQVLIRPSSFTNEQSRGEGGGQLRAIGYTLQGMLPTLFDTHSDRIITNAPLPEGRYDFIVVEQSHSDQDPNVLMQEALERTFGLTAHHETNLVNALALKVKETNAPGLTPSPTRTMHFKWGPGEMSGMSTPSTLIASTLENLLETPVVDETGLTNDFGYDVSLKFDQKWPAKADPDVLKKAVREQLGLELVPVQRPIDMLVVDAQKKTGAEVKR